ncbi:rRNA-processing protein las1 [Mycoemilia scoparia]|uniref:rRNA-processing protein las1 n=1 Tax=Mycoemilia scoparia TaxID=417184 RepID=A0A9W8A099_9FUNG|nr:rRNA-processing protein las1 [Mycoemilia scoparia]
MSRVPRIVPWASTGEFSEVASLFYSDINDLDSLEYGVDIVKAWRGRCKVPVAVEVTASLMEVLVFDGRNSDRSNTSKSRLMYAMALTRFVNSIIDQEQHGFYAQSIVSKAEQIGMPTWIVELRHASTHEALPSISVLRTGCRQAVDWLYSSFWKIQTDIHNDAYLVDIRSEVRSVLQMYVTQRNSYLHQKSASKTGRVKPKGKPKDEIDFMDIEGVSFNPRPDSSAALKQIKYITSILNQDIAPITLVPILLEPGFIVPEEKKLRSKHPECKLHNNVLMLWKQAIREFESAWGSGCFIQNLLLEIVSTFNADPENPVTSLIINPKHGSISSSYAFTLVAWVKWILDQYYGGVQLFSESININQFLEACLRNPNIYTRSILQIMCQLDSTLVQDLRPFIDYMAKRVTILSSQSTEQDKKSKISVKRLSEKEMQKIEQELEERLSNMCPISKKSSITADYVKIYPQEFIHQSWKAVQDGESNKTIEKSTNPQANLPSARWQFVDSTWEPCPIGTVPGKATIRPTLLNCRDGQFQLVPKLCRFSHSHSNFEMPKVGIPEKRPNLSQTNEAHSKLTKEQILKDVTSGSRIPRATDNAVLFTLPLLHHLKRLKVVSKVFGALAISAGPFLYYSGEGHAAVLVLTTLAAALPLGFIHIWPMNMISTLSLAGDRIASKGRVLHLINPKSFKDDHELIISKFTILGTEKQNRVKVKDLELASSRRWHATWQTKKNGNKSSEPFYLPGTFIISDPVLKALYLKIKMNSEDNSAEKPKTNN